MATALPFLMFQGRQAEEAMSFYTSLFADGAIEAIERFGPEGPGAEGAVMGARFRVAGQVVRCFDSPPVHAFSFTPSFSFFVECENEEELGRLTDGLGEGGEMLMPPDDYGFSRKYCWLTDRFGVSWQLNLS
ncbi:MAG TPA: VOC family protein [Allosphingosinicella sp.]|jgi:predicted 3-demethylubiquinone-9 3-methyltransferase (glyoxalase superfamily)